MKIHFRFWSIYDHHTIKILQLPIFILCFVLFKKTIIRSYLILSWNKKPPTLFKSLSPINTCFFYKLTYFINSHVIRKADFADNWNPRIVKHAQFCLSIFNVKFKCLNHFVQWSSITITPGVNITNVSVVPFRLPTRILILASRDIIQLCRRFWLNQHYCVNIL